MSVSKIKINRNMYHRLCRKETLPSEKQYWSGFETSHETVANGKPKKIKAIKMMTEVTRKKKRCNDMLLAVMPAALLAVQLAARLSAQIP